ncbi:HEAT repeat domain-containing protein [Chondromyces apiculatus]|uniref:HEAT repeat protein n=1 Tax=Chondromyces apiculatus DSM 436 TaxID=1192034 RepID=A0A017T7P4_9BACT|nr:HEAT repeat domain-containing protein [Chondromyces apiculatus]EYF04992.1 Hypothetical protein CAP_3803 [Chondromyces apiculatus DSM 436]
MTPRPPLLPTPSRTALPLLALLAGAFTTLSGATSVAAAADEPTHLVPAAAGQQALALRVGPSAITARACAAAPCTPDGANPLTIPTEIAGRLATAGAARVRTVQLEDGKRLARVDIPGDTGVWVALLAAPLTGKPSAPVLLWSGWTDIQRGEHGEERSQIILEEPAGKGHRVIVGQRRADVTLCGRPTVVAARAVDPATMTLTRGATVQNLPDAERARAVKLTAVRRDTPYVAPGFQLLRPTAASSAIAKRIAEIADRDPVTSWAEAKAGAGRGEFISFSAPSEVAIRGLELRIRPSRPLTDTPIAGPDAASPKAPAASPKSTASSPTPTAAPDPASVDGAAPSLLYLATEDRLFSIAVPADAWSAVGAGFEVTLPEELHASCVALVLDTTSAPRGVKDPQVTLSEVTARTDFDAMTPDALVGALAGGGPRATAAAAVLARSGPPAIRAAMEGYARLDQQGRLLAMGVIDGSSCADHVDFFAERLAESATAAAAARKQVKVRGALLPEGPEPEAHHAHDRVRRCGRAAAPALVKILARKPDLAALTVMARELALAAPDVAITTLLDTMTTANDATRRELRAALSVAAQAPRARLALEAELTPENAPENASQQTLLRPEKVRIDLLRAMGPALARVEGSTRAFQRLATPSASFDTRYLLLAPASELARGSDPAATTWLRAALRRDPDPHIRARAAEVAARASALTPDLLAAVADPEVRVREAAIGSLAELLAAGAAVPAGSEAAFSRRLGEDPWTFVRARAARALAALPVGIPRTPGTPATPATPRTAAAKAADQALARAVSDLYPEVRGEALDALGARRAIAHRDVVRARAEEPEELTEVRARALLALGEMCDRDSIALFTTLAQRARTPMGERDERLGQAAIAALSRIHPADLNKRLAPLLDKGVPRPIQETARAALEEPGQCR